MTPGKYSIFDKSKNPFNKNIKTPPSSFKKGSVMFDENYYGIIQSLPFSSFYYNTEDNSTYYDGFYFDDVNDLGNKFHVNYLKKY